MSASDAAPLPRLGEVFFDVRGSSRSMRLSWYADTDVAVFSIWQGGMCTGTFRLPMGDLARMIEILQRGPDVRDERGAGERGDPAYREDRRDDSDYYDDDYRDPGQRDPGRRDAVYQDDYQDDRYGDYSDRAGDHGAGYADPGYGDQAYEPEYDRPSRGRRRANWPDDDRYQPDATGQRSVAPDETGYHETGYGQQRFVPPYVRAEPDPSQGDYLDDSEYRLPADPGGGARHSAGRHSGGQPR